MLSDSLSIARPSVGAQVNDVIDHIAAKLSVPVAHLYSVLVRQGVVEGVIDLVSATLVFVILVAALVVLYKSLRSYQAKLATNRYFSDGFEFAGSFCGAVVAVLMTIVFVCLLRDGLREVLNPEYYAIQTIISALKGGG